MERLKRSNVIYIEDYLDSKPGRVRRPLEDFDKQVETAGDKLRKSLGIIKDKNGELVMGGKADDI
jgi:hypothetical protein